MVAPRVRAWGAVVLSVMFAACSDGGSAMLVDAGTADAGSVIAPPAPPALPASAALPDLAPCPTGWREIAGDGVTTCEPWPATGVVDCGPGQAHFPGEPGCMPVGAPCPAGEFSERLPAGRPVLHVRSGASGGNGTLALPFGRIADAVRAASSGTIVAVAKGSYDEVVTLRAGVTLWGACAAETTVSSSVASTLTGVIASAGVGAEVHDLRVGLSVRPGVTQTAGTLLLDGVAVEGATGLGISASGGSSLTANDVVVRDTRTGTGTFATGVGLFVDNSRAQLRRIAVERARDTGIIGIGAPVSITLEDAVVRGTFALASGAGGHGISIEEGASLTATKVVLENNREIGLHALEPGTVVELDQVVVRDTTSGSNPETGQGIRAQLSATVTARHLLLERNQSLAVWITGASLTLEDTVVRDTLASRAGSLGIGAGVEAGASLDATRVLFVRNRQVGIDLRGTGTTATLRDLSVIDMLTEEASGDGGRGLNVYSEASVTVERMSIERSSEAAVLVSEVGTVAQLGDVTIRDIAEGSTGSGALLAFAVGAQGGASLRVSRLVAERTGVAAISVLGAGTSAALEDLTLLDTVSRSSDGSAGMAIAVQESATATLARARIERAQAAGIVATGEGSQLEASDVAISETRASPLSGKYGRGVAVQRGASMTLSRALLDRNRELGASAATGTLVLTHVRIARTAARDCASSSCAGMGYGIGIGSYFDGTVTATDFEVVDSPLCGLQLATGGAMDLAEGIVAGSEIGACIQTEGFDSSRIARSVSYRDNGTSISATMLPVPEIGAF